MAFWDNIRFPYFNMQELNLDWIMKELKRIAGFMPQDGNVGDILTRKSEGAAWEPPEAVNININALPEDTEIGDNDQLIFYDISAQANRKIKPPNLLDSMMSNGTPLMDGTASPGTSKKPARYDHKHPTDTSRQAALSGAQMAAVNSGAPANSFDANGILKFANGGINDSGSSHCKMPDGTLILWGTAINDNTGTINISFPISFINETYAITAAPRYSPSYPHSDFRAISQKDGATGCKIKFVALSSGTAYTTAVIADWLAIGRWK